MNKNSDKNIEIEPAKRCYASSLTYALLLCLAIVGYSVFLNICKIISYQGKIMELHSIQTETTEKNISLKQQLSDLNARSYEAIARNNLKMSGENEVLIVVRQNEKEEDIKKKKTKKNKKDKE